MSKRWGSGILLALAVACLSGQEASAACVSGVQVTSASASGADFSATLANPTNKSFQGYLGVAVTLKDGSTGLASIPISVPAGGSTTAGASFPAEIVEINDTETCNKVPWGITESPDPVIVIRPPEEGNGNGDA